VLARNEVTHEQGYFTVTATHQTYRDHTLAVVLGIDGREETIVTTSDHPFYDVREGFVEASKLVAGDWVALADGGYATVLRLETRVVGQFVYNLTVDQAHTYFVGDAQVWVHNCPHFVGTEKAWASGATPNSKWTQVHPTMRDKAIQTTIYDKKGRAIGQVDWKKQHGAASGHGHGLTRPGDFSSGHQGNGLFYPPGQLPLGWGNLPSGISPIHPL
jgi:hypothetical protein